MRLFHTETPKDIQNVYAEFESCWSWFFVDVDHEIHFEDIQEGTANQFGLFLETIREFSLALKKHVLKQIKEYGQIELEVFIEEQRLYLVEYNPEMRKKELHNAYLIEYVASGDSRILDKPYSYGVGERERLKNAFEAYATVYWELSKDLNDLFQSMESKGIIKPLEKKNPKVPELISKLNEFGFAEYLRGKEIELAKVSKMLSTNSGKNFVSYGIALIVEVGFYKHFRDHYCNAIDKTAHKRLGKVFDRDERTIRGNVNAMNPHSNDTHYKSHLFKQSIEKELRGT